MSGGAMTLHGDKERKLPVVISRRGAMTPRLRITTLGEFAVKTLVVFRPDAAERSLSTGYSKGSEERVS
jgi:hypothetical protein